MHRATRTGIHTRLAAMAALGLGLFVGLFAPCSSGARQAGDDKAGLSGEAQERVRQAAAAVGQIWVRRTSDPATQSPRPRGSAVIVRPDGTVVTNYHVIAEDRSDRLYDEIHFSLTSVAGDDPSAVMRYRLKVALINRAKDLALLRIIPKEAESGAVAVRFSAIAMGDSRAIKLLESLIIIGYPEKGGATVTLSAGMVEGTDLLDDWIKTDARLIHGNSGGAAVTKDGRLIGIPTKVIADRQPVDKDGDGFPDDYRWYGAVGFLRPAYLVEAMLAELGRIEARAAPPAAERNPAAPAMAPPATQAAPLVTLSGIVRSAVDRTPIAGARVGLTPMGTEEVTATNLLTWGGTNGEGQFRLNKAIPAGRYTLKARAIGYDAVSLNIEIDQKTAPVVVELRPSR